MSWLSIGGKWCDGFVCYEVSAQVSVLVKSDSGVFFQIQKSIWMVTHLFPFQNSKRRIMVFVPYSGINYIVADRLISIISSP